MDTPGVALVTEGFGGEDMGIFWGARERQEKKERTGLPRRAEADFRNSGMLWRVHFSGQDPSD
jgi:hypothetical protein